MWESIQRLAKPNAAIALFCKQPFTSALIMSNYDAFKYCWYWRKIVGASKHGRILGARPNQVGIEFTAYTGFPDEVLEFPNITGDDALHPTQKPIELCEFLVETYTRAGERVLDFTMGSGSTLLACYRTGRAGVGIELESAYVAIAEQRLYQERLYAGAVKARSRTIENYTQEPIQI